MLFLLYYTTFSTVLQYKFPEFFVNITNHRAERKDKRENRREEVRLRRGLIENERFTAPLCKGDLRVCEARLQASPRGVVKTIPQSACADSSLYTREPEKLCTHSPITEVSFAKEHLIRQPAAATFPYWGRLN